MDRQEAIQIIKNNWPNGRQMLSEALEFLIPELKESEDEKIRKELITWLQSIEGQSLPIDRHNAAIAWLEKQGEQKPTEWSDRDWYYYSKLESFLEVKDHYSPTESSSGYQKDVHETLIWLKSLRPNKYVTWSEEDELMLNDIITCNERHGYLTAENISWLKSLKPQPKQKWSEGDEIILNKIIQDYEAVSKSFCGHRGKLDWLKSLKERIKEE